MCWEWFCVCVCGSIAAAHGEKEQTTLFIVFKRVETLDETDYTAAPWGWNEKQPWCDKRMIQSVCIYIIIITLLFWVHGWSSNNNENGSAESAVEWQPSPNTAAWPTSGPWEFIRGAAGNYWFDGNLFIHSTSLFCLLLHLGVTGSDNEMLFH